jgi:hypothetical protein
VLFYLSLVVFFLGLPPILSFALGYKFNSRTFKFTQAGIISIKTQPDGATIYLNGKLLAEKTPATINELLPGSYDLRIELKDYNSWSAKINVEPRKVSRFEKIILFSRRPDIQQLNQERVSYFWLDKENTRAYYFDQQDNIIYQSDLRGERFEEICSLPASFSFRQMELKISPDRSKMLIFNPRQILIFNLQPSGQLSYSGPTVILDYTGGKISNIFWHSDNYHLILIADRNIDVLEAESLTKPVNLMRLNKKASVVSYDNEKDELYFIDSQRGSDGQYYDNVYKLELSSKVFLMDKLRAIKNERE